MKNYLCFILLFISLGLQAQAWVKYPDQIIGYQTNDDLFMVSVLNYSGVEIDFIYKGRILDEDGTILFESSSGTISNKPGRISFDKSMFPDLLIRKEKVDVSKYTGTLTFVSELLHPLDTVSVIAREKKQVVLKNGLSVDEKGNPMIDPNKVHTFVKISEGKSFEIKDKAFDTIFFNNQNVFDACLDLEVIIKQDQSVIYKAVVNSICVPPGISKMTLAQKEKLEIEFNKYHLRNYTQSINPFVSVGNGEIGTEVSAQLHANWTSNYVNYKSNSTGLSFDFFEHATERLVPAPNTQLVTFDEQGDVSDIENMRSIYLRNDPFTIHSPYGFSLGRPDINGNIIMKVLPADNFTPEQWASYLNHIGHLEKGVIKKVKFEDFEIWTQGNLNNFWPIEGWYDFENNTFSFLLKDEKRVFLFQFYKYRYQYIEGKVEANFSDSIDVKKILNAIVYNNRKLNFQFSKTNDLEKITFSAIGPPENPAVRDSIFNRYLEYYCLLEQETSYRKPGIAQSHESFLNDLDLRHKDLDSSKDCSFFKIKKIVPGEPDFRKYKNYSWDSLGIKVSYRQNNGKDYRPPSVQQFSQKYVYNKDFEIVKHQIQFDQNYNAKDLNLKDGHQIFETERLVHRLEPERFRNISIAKILYDQPDERLLVAIVDKNRFKRRPNEQPGTLIKEVDKWKVIIPESFNSFKSPGRYEALFIIKSDEDVFVFAVIGKIKSDILDFMNSITIKGQRFHFEYDKDKKLKNVSIK